MTEYTIADVSAGDRVTLEHDAFWVSVGGEVSHEPVTGLYFYEEQTDRNLWLCDLLPLGWRITAVVKPEPVLPTEPGHYRHRADNVIYLHPDGNWFYGMEHVDIETVRGLAPFTRLAPVPETAKKVLAAIEDLWTPGEHRYFTYGHAEQIAAEFGVTTTRQGDKK